MLQLVFKTIKAQFISFKYLHVEDPDLIFGVVNAVTNQLSWNHGDIMKVTAKRVCRWLRAQNAKSKSVSVGRILAALHKLGFLEYAGRHGAYKVYFAKKDSWNPQAAYKLLRRKMLEH